MDLRDAEVTVHAAGADRGDELSVLRATAHAVWQSDLAGRPFAVCAGDDTAAAALQRWSLLSAPIG